MTGADVLFVVIIAAFLTVLIAFDVADSVARRRWKREQSAARARMRRELDRHDQ